MSIKCGAYVRPNTFQPPGKGGLDAFFKTEAWPYWASAEKVKLEVGLYFDAAQRILSADKYSYFYAKFQRMRADFDKEWVTVKGYSDTLTFWCTYIKRGIEWDTQFRALRQEMKNAIQTAEQQAKYEASQSSAASSSSSSTTASKPETKSAAEASPAEKKAAETKAKDGVKEESTKAKNKNRRNKTDAAAEAAGGNTEKAAQDLVKGGEPAGTVAGPTALDIALWVGGGILALGVLWTFLPETKPAVVEKVMDKVLPTTGTAGFGSFGRYRRNRRR
jgi:hypothetical protein